MSDLRLASPRELSVDTRLRSPAELPVVLDRVDVVEMRGG